MSVSPGTHLGPYDIQAPIGAGGMGEVYRARDTRLDRTVAIKVMAAPVSLQPVFTAGNPGRCSKATMARRTTSPPMAAS